MNVKTWASPSFDKSTSRVVNMNFTGREYLYHHRFTLSMVTCTVQKVGRKSVDVNGNGMCLYYTAIPWFRGNPLKIGL